MKKKLLVLVAAVLAIAMAMSMCACGSTTTEKSEISASDSGNVISPLDSAYTVENLDDCTANVSFTSEDFDWENNCVYATIYDVLTYDAVDVQSIEEGSVLETGDGDVQVNTVTETDDGILINEGEDNQQLLQPQDGGTYQIVGDNDIRAMRLLGEAELTLADDVVLHDRDNEDPNKVVDVSTDKLKTYIDGLTDTDAEFDPYSTTVVIEGGVVTEINRVWMP